VKSQFKKIGLMGRQRNPESIECLQVLYEYLSKSNHEIIIEEDTASFLPGNFYSAATKEEFGKQVDLVIVVGGDGSLLKAAQFVVDHGTPVIGVNRGRLGFLTDIHPDEMTDRLEAVLNSEYIEEKRFLLNAEIHRQGNVIYKNVALNDVVLFPGGYTHMIEYEIYINKQFVCSQSADGQIIATPTGSTAYALSGGGPILHPSLDAIVLVPMFPHTLSSRPIVVDGNSKIEFKMIPRFETAPKVSCDGQERISIAPGDTLHVYKKAEYLKLLHPKDYNYYDTLRQKLYWEKKLV
jgi:NAD+ kinase